MCASRKFYEEAESGGTVKGAARAMKVMMREKVELSFGFVWFRGVVLQGLATAMCHQRVYKKTG